jgi:hypothetical protein
MKFCIGDKVLVTVEGWFIAPDGAQYKSVFGAVKGVHTAELTLGIKPNGKSANWYLEIGNVLIAGCQIHYVIKTDAVNGGRGMHYETSTEHGLKEWLVPCRIYMADGE